METEPVPKLMLRFALPAVVGMVAGAIYNIVDRIFVGHYVGPAGLAAITVSFPPMLMTIAFALLICIGGSSRVAILFGAKRIEEAERALASTFVREAHRGGGARARLDLRAARLRGRSVHRREPALRGRHAAPRGRHGRGA